MLRWPELGLKLPTWRSRRWLALANGQACVRCGACDGTVVGAHYCGIYADEFGRGGGVKVADNMVADLCQRCHAELDDYSTGNDDARALEFWRCIFRTQARRLAADPAAWTF